jgi:hypothetical protein
MRRDDQQTTRISTELKDPWGDAGCFAFPSARSSATWFTALPTITQPLVTHHLLGPRATGTAAAVVDPDPLVSALSFVVALAFA